MNIHEALLKEINIRVSCGHRWLVIDELHHLGGEFVVYERLPYKKHTTEVFRGYDEEEAVFYLIGENGENK